MALKEGRVHPRERDEHDVEIDERPLSHQEPTTNDALPQPIAHYRLQKRIGIGGMGEVWLAYHELLERPVAVKLIRPERLAVSQAARHEMIRRFEREARATAAMRSPHTIQIFDFGTTADGTFYYVMEFLDGLSLEELVKQYGPLPAERVIYLLRQICESLAEAHEHGLVHRDVKPSNIFACRLGLRTDFAKVLDFGLVKSTTNLDVADSLLTQDGLTLGSPAFMPPEAIRGQVLDARADIYTLGCLGYWLLTGKLVFEGETALAIMAGHAERTPIPPREQTQQMIPDALEALILACLSKKPSDRPASIQDIARHLATINTSLATPWTEERSLSWWQRHVPPIDLKELGAKDKQKLSKEEQKARREKAQEVLLHHFTESHINVMEYERRLAVVRAAENEADFAVAIQNLPKLSSPKEPPQDAPSLKGSQEKQTQKETQSQETLKNAPTEKQQPDASPKVQTAHAAPELENPEILGERRHEDALVSVLGSSSRRGLWKPARWLKSLNILGSTVLDFRQASLAPGVTEVHCVSVLGNTVLIVPPDIQVNVDGIGILGDFTDQQQKSLGWLSKLSGRKSQQETQPPRAVLHVSGVAVLGTVRIVHK